MIAKLAAVLLVVLTLSPFTVPFSTFDVVQPGSFAHEKISQLKEASSKSIVSSFRTTPEAGLAPAAVGPLWERPAVPAATPAAYPTVLRL